MFSYQQVRHFRDSGYLRLPEVLAPSLTQQARNWVIDQQNANHPRYGRPVRSDGQVKIYGLYDRAPKFMGRLIAHPGIIEPLSALLGPNIVFVSNRHNQAAVNAPGDSEPRLHRDVLQWTRNLVTAVVYLDDSTTANGCTLIVPGSQYAPFMGVPQPCGGGTWMDEHKELRDLMAQAIPVPMPAGGVLLFDSLAFHSVGANLSSASRISMVFGYRSVDELDSAQEMDDQILVAGERIYRGNDRTRAVIP